MDIAIGLGLAVASQTWSAYRQRAGSGEYAVCAVRGGKELLNLRLHRAVAGSKVPEAVANDFQLTWQGTAVRVPQVRLEMSPRLRVERARRHLCSGFEFSWHRSAAWVASGMLTFALAVLSGADSAQAAVQTLPIDTLRAVQCPVEAPRADRMLADVTAAARYRTFSRTRDAGKIGTREGQSYSTIETKPGKPEEVRHNDYYEYVDISPIFSGNDKNGEGKRDGNTIVSVKVTYRNGSGTTQHINQGVGDAGDKRHVNATVEPPDNNDKSSQYVVDGWESKNFSELGKYTDSGE